MLFSRPNKERGGSDLQSRNPINRHHRRRKTPSCCQELYEKVSLVETIAYPIRKAYKIVCTMPKRSKPYRNGRVHVLSAKCLIFVRAT